jgi:hypothetical protein
MGRSAVRILIPLVGAVVVLAALAALGRWARDSLREDERYSFDFAAIDCTPPTGLAKDQFLTEVQYLAGLPNQLVLLDDALAARLKEGFGRHPWVEQVENVRISPHRIEVQLHYRKPALAVMWGGKLRAVDEAGVLLPAMAETGGLPVYPTTPAPPAGPAGTPWGDPEVAAAARAAAGR